MIYGQPLRILHSLLALCMLGQLAIGELMDVPGAQDADEQAAISLIQPALAHGGHHAAQQMIIVEETLGYQVHEILGLTIAGLLLIRLMLAFSSIPGASWRGLFPWLSGEGRCALLSESKAQATGWKQGKLAPPEEGETVARAVHGFMLLTALGIATAGVALFFGWNEHGRQSELIEFVGETHETLVGLFEALLGAHVLAVILHQMQGHNILTRIRPGKS
ncbi:MAG: cytochrome b/b6 domain-containing protein [Mariprofundaceae bacterium]|nr:cytochrome b/b6 domain-containing protein [Mariprofundaceae bacterium]